MPSVAEHTAKHCDNRTFLDSNGGLAGQVPIWAAIVAFYSAVHLVEKLAAQEGKHHKRHVGPASRDLYIAGHRKHRVILSDFTALRAASEIARYEAMTTFQTSYPGGIVQSRLIDQCLSRIETHVTNHFAALHI